MFVDRLPAHTRARQQCSRVPSNLREPAPEFTEGDLNRLFLPFSDLTSGTETYAAGRFLDLDRTATRIYELDFNRAYIPYCYYNAAFECPYPPAENRLKIPIRAGERMKTAANAAPPRTS